MKKISSPDEIDDYMKVTSPSVWVVLAAIILILVAIFVWSVTKQIESNILVGEQVISEEIVPIELLME